MRRIYPEIVIITILIVGLAALSVVLGLRVRTQQKEVTSLAAQLQTSRTDSTISDQIIQEYRRQQTEQTNAEPTASSQTIVYAVGSSLAVTEERRLVTVEDSTFRFKDYASGSSSLIGIFATVSGASPLELTNLPNGSVRLHGIYDELEVASSWDLYLNPKTRKTLAISGGQANRRFGAEGRRIDFSDGQAGLLTGHVLEDACENKSTATIDQLMWNKHTLLDFSPPISVSCDYTEMMGSYPHFLIDDPQVALDMQSVTFGLSNGKKLLVRSTGSGVTAVMK